MMKRRIIGIILIISLVLTNGFTFAEALGANPSREVLENKIEQVARKRNIPTVLLKSIARVESVFQQFNPDGSAYISHTGDIGMMQINSRSYGFDISRLKTDVDYNIEAGAEMLIRKWNRAVKYLPNIGDMNPNILENWYFAIWAYNGWHESNNPNQMPYRSATLKKNYAYQDLVYMMAETEFDQKITPIDPTLLPRSGLPDKGTSFDTPTPMHYGDIVMYKAGDIMQVDVSSSLRIRNTPNGDVIGKFNGGDIVEIIEEAKLEEGYYWYKVKEKLGNKEGWVAGTWIKRIHVHTPIEEEYVFEDISGSWAKKYITQLKELGIVEGSGKNFHPNRSVTRQEVSVFLSRTLGLEVKDIDSGFNYIDSGDISFWALESVKALQDEGYLEGTIKDGKFNPQSQITREDMAIIISNILGYEEDIDIEFGDVERISENAYKAAQNVCKKGIMHKNILGLFDPNGPISRAEMCKMLIKMLDTIKLNEPKEETVAHN